MDGFALLDDGSMGPGHPTYDLGLKLKAHEPIRDLMLTYVAMILNHHRLSQQQKHPHLPLHLVDLFLATQQVGAFQVRVRRSLAQVLFGALQRFSFWTHWADWVIQVLEAWQEEPPRGCLMPGLLPLQAAAGVWSWRETVVIQAMTLEAAHQLVESLPAEALQLQALEELLGLQDALVGDSSTVDPRGFESVPLGLPILPEKISAIRVKAEMSDPAIRRLPWMAVRFSRQGPLQISAAQVLSSWVWEVTQRLGIEMGYMALILVSQGIEAMDSGRSCVRLVGREMIQQFPWLTTEPAAMGLRSWMKRMSLLTQSMIQLEEDRLDLGQVWVNHEFLWQVDQGSVSQGLRLVGGHAGETFHYGVLEVQQCWMDVALGAWWGRISEGSQARERLTAVGTMAQQLLRVDPVTQRFAAKGALFLAHQFWMGQRRDWTVGQLWHAVEPMEPIQAVVGHAMRRYSFFQAWAVLWDFFCLWGWTSTSNPLEPWQEVPLGATNWLDVPVFLQVAGQGAVSPMGRVDLQDEAVQNRWVGLTARTGEALAISPMRREAQNMDGISSQDLERALAVRGMSQAKLARSLNLDRSTINRWINGSRTIHPRYRPALWELLGSDLRRS